jgi:hypothetical protein
MAGTKVEAMSASKMNALVKVRENRLVILVFISIRRILNRRNFKRRSFEPGVRMHRI